MDATAGWNQHEVPESKLNRLSTIRHNAAGKSESVLQSCSAFICAVFILIYVHMLVQCSAANIVSFCLHTSQPITRSILRRLRCVVSRWRSEITPRFLHRLTIWQLRDDCKHLCMPLEQPVIAAPCQRDGVETAHTHTHIYFTEPLAYRWKIITQCHATIDRSKTSKRTVYFRYSQKRHINDEDNGYRLTHGRQVWKNDEPTHSPRSCRVRLSWTRINQFIEMSHCLRKRIGFIRSEGGNIQNIIMQLFLTYGYYESLAHSRPFVGRILMY
jgi:hypothetical protein